MQSLQQQFLTYARSKPASVEYNFRDSGSCAFFQFATAMGIPSPNRYSYDLPEQLLQPLKQEPTTWGALTKRLEALNA